MRQFLATGRTTYGSKSGAVFYKMNYAFSKLYLRLLFFVSKCSSLVCSGLLYVQIDASKIVGVSFGVNRKIIV